MLLLMLVWAFWNDQSRSLEPAHNSTESQMLDQITNFEDLYIPYAAKAAEKGLA